MAIILGPKQIHHPSCPARYDALGCICPVAAVSGERQLLESEQESLRRYLEVRQARVSALRPAAVA